MKHEKNIIVIVGLPCSGKTTVSSLFERNLISKGFKCDKRKISGLIKLFCEEKNIKASRSNQRTIKNAFCEIFGVDYWVKNLLDIFFDSDFNFLVVDGAWLIEELLCLRRIKNCRIIALSASHNELERRLILRNEDMQEQARVSEVQKNFPIETFFNLANEIWDTECLKEKTESMIIKFIDEY